MVVGNNGKVKVKNQVVTENYCIYNDDCCEAIKGIRSESVGFSVFSPPFASLYSYSDDNKDMGNAKTYKEFFIHFGFLVAELHRVLMPGIVVAVHCMDLPVFKANEGHIGMRDFSGDIIRLFQKHEFIYHSRHCIWKDPLVAATRSKSIQLAHKQIVKDSALCATGIPDYIVAFRKGGENPVPIAHPNGLTEYAGERPIPWNLDVYIGSVEPKTNKRSHWIWQQYASPVWFDIRQTRVLPYRGGREEEDQRHICPLQTDVVERCLTLWSAKDDKVLTPFMGVGTEVYEAVRLGRKGIGIELKTSYFKMAKRNLESLKYKQTAGGFSE